MISAQHRGQPEAVRLARILLLGTLAALLPGVVPRAQSPDFDNLSARAAQARDAGNLPQAIELYKQATQQKPDWPEGWWYLGVLSYSANQYPGAIDAFSHLLRLQPGAVPAIVMRGLSEFETAAYGDALRDLEQAAAQGAANDPRNEQQLRFHLGQLLARAGRFQEALEQYAVFARRGIENPDLYAGIGAAGMQRAVLVGAIPAAEREMSEAAGRAAYPVLAGDSTVGDERFRELFARYPNTPGLHFFYGFLLYPHDSADLTIEQFQAELAVAPANEMARAYLALTLMMAGQFDEARDEAEKVLVAPGGSELGHEMAQVALGRSLIELGGSAKGEALLKQVLARDDDNMEAHLGLAALYSRTGRKEDARRERMACLRLAK